MIKRASPSPRFEFSLGLGDFPRQVYLFGNMWMESKPQVCYNFHYTLFSVQPFI